MDTDDVLDAQVNQLAVMILVTGGPTALASVQDTSRFDRMARELEYAIRHTSNADMSQLMGHLVSDGGTALIRRVTGLWDFGGKLLSGTTNELEGMLRAYSADHLADHLKKRVGTASAITSATVSSGATTLSSLVRDLMANPAETGPKLLVLVLSSVVVSGGVDGNGGVPDLDIPLMGIGDHRSPFTHSIIIGSLLEAGVLMLTRIVVGTHKNLPAEHDPLWDSLAQHSAKLLKAAGQGASMGMAYHLMVDAVVQPGAYHGMPFDMPLEAHQAIFAANSVAEATAVKSYPDEETVNATPEFVAAHKKYKATRMLIPPVLQEFLTPTEIGILAKDGAWLKALAKRDISPMTIAQVQFLMVADGNRLPVSAHEKAWVALVDAKRRACWTTSAGSGPMYGV